MHWLLRLVLFSGLSGLTFYIFGLPILLDTLSQKVQTESYQQCMQQLTSQSLTGNPGSPITQELAYEYCHCMSDKLVMTQDDIMELAQQRIAMKAQTTPKALAALVASQSETCGQTLQLKLGAPPVISSPPAAIAPRPTTKPADPNLIHL